MDIELSDRVNKKLADVELAHKLCDLYVRIRHFAPYTAMLFNGTYNQELLTAVGIKLPIDDQGSVVCCDKAGVPLVTIELQPNVVHVFKDGSYLIRRDRFPSLELPTDGAITWI